MHPFQKRILKEYRSLQKNSLPGVKLIPATEDELNISTLTFSVTLPPDSDGVLHLIYKSDTYYLRVVITKEYPVDSPQVQFIKLGPLDRIPMHPHIYGNGHICLDILGTGWTPACTIESIILSLQSMLSTNELNERPPDNDQYMKSAPLNPKRSNFVYHDDNV